jgi:hypothetical protein
MNQMTKYFGPVYPGLRGRDLRARIDLKSIVRHGRFRLSDDGDRIRTAALVDGDPIARDNSYVRVSFPLSTYLHCSQGPFPPVRSVAGRKRRPGGRAGCPNPSDPLWAGHRRVLR